MRNTPTDNYKNISLIGNNICDIYFMKCLLQSQNVDVTYCEKFILRNEQQKHILKNIAYYFGTRGPVLIDNNGLIKLFKENGIESNYDLPNLSSSDIISQIDMCLQSDIVYVCNSNGILDKYTMFMLGYLMANNKEIYFWNDIDKSEWLISCISIKNNNYGEIVQFPLEIVRSLAYPYLFKNIKTDLEPGIYGKLVITEEGKLGVDTKADFDLQVASQTSKEKTVSILGSLRKQLQSINEKSLEFKENGYDVLAPNLSNIKQNDNGFIIFEDDISDEPTIIESDFLEKCLKSENIIVCNEKGYIGNTVTFEIGYLLAKDKNIQFIQEPSDIWIKEVVNHFSENNNIKK